MKIKAAIFDMDGTLIDSLHYWESFWRKLGKEYLNDDAFLYDKELDRRVRTMIFTEAIAAIRERYGLTCSIEELSHFASDTLEDFYKEEATVKAGSVAFLEHLKAEGVKMCLASATELLYVRLALEHHGLAPYFDCVLSCADLGKGKDVPDIYLKSLEALGVCAEDACVFEDSYVALETAKGIGCQTVGIFDPCNYGQDRLAAASNIYIAEGHTVAELIPVVSLGE